MSPAPSGSSTVNKISDALEIHDRIMTFYLHVILYTPYAGAVYCKSPYCRVLLYSLITFSNKSSNCYLRVHFVPSSYLPGGVNDLLAVKVHVNSCNNMSINCTFLDSFQGVGYCEIKLSNVDSTFTYCQRSQRRASAGGSVWVNNITLNASMIYLYNVSALLEDESTPAVVVQDIITSLPTSRTHIGKLVFTYGKLGIINTNAYVFSSLIPSLPSCFCQAKLQRAFPHVSMTSVVSHSVLCVTTVIPC